MTLEKRVETLEKYMNAILKKIDNDKFYNEADKSGMRHSTAANADSIEQNTADIDFIAMEAGIDLEEGN